MASFVGTTDGAGSCEQQLKSAIIDAPDNDLVGSMYGALQNGDAGALADSLRARREKPAIAAGTVFSGCCRCALCVTSCAQEPLRRVLPGLQLRPLQGRVASDDRRKSRNNPLLLSSVEGMLRFLCMCCLS